jgi:hypothetical protein
LSQVTSITEAVLTWLKERQTEFLQLIDLSLQILDSPEVVVPSTKTGNLLGGPVPSASVLLVSLALPSGV